MQLMAMSIESFSSAVRVPSVSEVERKSQMASARRCLGVVDEAWKSQSWESQCVSECLWRGVEKDGHTMVECWPDGALNLRVKGGGAEVKSQKCVLWEKLTRHEIRCEVWVQKEKGEIQVGRIPCSSTTPNGGAAAEVGQLRCAKNRNLSQYL